MPLYGSTAPLTSARLVEGRPPASCSSWICPTAGLRGPTGRRGPTGHRGSTGLHGPTGHRGPNGHHGPTGLRGLDQALSLIHFKRCIIKCTRIEFPRCLFGCI